MSITKSQHYVPLFYLKGFSKKQESLYILDKEQNKIFYSNIANICQENYFYSYKNNGIYDLEVEKKLSTKEGEFASALQSIIEFVENSVPEKVTRPHRNIRHSFMEFVLYQIIRVPRTIDKLFALNTRAFEWFNKKNDEAQTQNEIKNDIKKFTFPHLFIHTDKMMEILRQKNWVFHVLKKNDISFVSTDNPVMITCADTKSHFRGLINPSTEISIPLNSKIVLSLCKEQCPWKYYIRRIDSIKRIKQMNIALANNANRFIYSQCKENLRLLND
jgi:hypothetical protein